MVPISSVGGLRKVLARFDDDLALKITSGGEEAFLLSDIQIARIDGAGEESDVLAVRLMTFENLAGLLAEHEARESHD